MSKMQLLQGRVYRIVGFLTLCRRRRSRLVSMGFIPGGELQCISSWFFDRYFLVRLGTQRYGMFYQELCMLKLHVIDND